MSFTLILFALAFPEYDIEASCTKGAAGDQAVFEFCMGAEKAMRITAQKRWPAAPDDRKSACLQENADFAASKGWPTGNYTRLNFCLSEPYGSGKGDRLK